MIKRIFYLITGLLLLTACSDKYEVNNETLSKATVTFLVSPNGLGDNGYNDVAAEGIFAFAGETGTRLRLLLPENEKEAEAMYRQWLAENAVKDSAVLILGSSAYEQMARQNPTAFTGVGSRVLLFESDAEIAGVSTVIISHYGVSYLAGAMSQNLSALILAAAPGVPSLEESIAGFQAARKLYAGENDGLPCTTKLRYLADGENKTISPELNVTKNSTPMFVFGTQDDVHSGPSSATILDAMQRAGAPIEVHFLVNGGHGYGMRGDGAGKIWPKLAESWLKTLK